MSEPSRDRAGEVRVHVIQPGVIGTVFSGHITKQVSNDMLREFVEALKQHPATHWIADTTRVTSFDVKIAPTAGAWHTAFKAQGGHTLITIASNAAVRVIGSSLGFATGMSSKMVASMEEALRLLPRGGR